MACRSDRSKDVSGSAPARRAQALAHALDYLKPFGLDALLRCGASFRPFAAAGELQLSPNALAQLEVLRNSDDGAPRGCGLCRAAAQAASGVRPRSSGGCAGPGAALRVEASRFTGFRGTYWLTGKVSAGGSPMPICDCAPRRPGPIKAAFLRI